MCMTPTRLAAYALITTPRSSLFYVRATVYESHKCEYVMTGGRYLHLLTLLPDKRDRRRVCASHFRSLIADTSRITVLRIT